MTSTGFQRARSPEAKQQREDAILAAATRLGAEHGIRQITLTGLAAAVDMHKSALLRYFETREQIFLRLTATSWQQWSADLLSCTGAMTADTPTSDVAQAFSQTLTSRPLFCDLLAHAPMNLERNVSLDQVRTFKYATHAEVETIVGELRRLRPHLTDIQAVDVIATATSMAGAMWQMATPAPEVAELYRSDPRLQLAVFDVTERLTRILRALIDGYLH
ncbi:TetR family transcriptional regulator [Mycobacterium sp. MS1601]|uniref:TetR/AcrR family transcriptional regulator n=1 Tax=Mycobacterium sp. MS1601 TaxID=1936029 RepID=UPI00097979C6|nr:TetR family transcriptional regulator [Mycobacterium sp. MS1601]AQA01201.1 TetR family transcriptional regulator [Mycobacterium sp. MS1601]